MYDKINLEMEPNPNNKLDPKASYIYNHGVDLNTTTPYSAFISYCIKMAVYHMTGNPYPTIITQIGSVTDGMKIIADAYNPSLPLTGSTLYSIGAEQKPVVVESIPVSYDASMLYYSLVADLISRRMYDHIDDPELRMKLRSRRIAEGNLIYSDVVGASAMVKFQMAPSTIPDYQSLSALSDRLFDHLINGVVYGYANGGSDGTKFNYNNIDVVLPNVRYSFSGNLKVARFWNSVFASDYNNAG